MKNEELKTKNETGSFLILHSSFCVFHSSFAFLNMPRKPTATVPNIAPAPKVAEIPAWYPAWAKEMAELYFSGTTCVFVLHGNVRDLIRCPTEADADHYANLPEFLATQVFGAWDVVLHYDLARGLRPLAGPDAAR